MLQVGSISEKSCAQVVASPRYSEPQRKNIDTSIAMSPCRHAGAPDYHHWCDFNTGSVGSQLAIVRTLEAYTCTYMYCTRLYGSCVGYPPRGYEAIEVRYSSTVHALTGWAATRAAGGGAASRFPRGTSRYVESSRGAQQLREGSSAPRVVCNSCTRLDGRSESSGVGVGARSLLQL